MIKQMTQPQVRVLELLILQQRAPLLLVSRNIKVRFVCPSLQKKEFKVRSKREHSPELHTVLHYSQRVKPCYCDIINRTF